MSNALQHTIAYWDLVPAAVGALIGALAGGLPAWLLAKRQSDETLRRDEKRRIDQERIAASRVFVKLSILANSILTLKKQIDEMDDRADQGSRSKMRLFERLSPIVGLGSDAPIEWEADDLTVFLSAKRVDFVDELLLLARQHVAIVVGFQEFGRLKTEHFYAHVSKGVTTRGPDGVTTTSLRLPTEEANLLRVKGEELELFVQGLRVQLNEYAERAHRIARDYGPIVHTYFGDKSLPALELKDEAVPAENASN